MSYLAIQDLHIEIRIQGSVETYQNNKHLFKAHWDEVGLMDYPVNMDGDLEYFDSCDKDGSGFMAVVYAGTIAIGYCHITISNNVHAKECNIANSSMLYIAKGWRNGIASKKLMNFVEAECVRRGAFCLNIASNLNKGIGFWLMRKGYNPMDVIYSKRLA